MTETLMIRLSWWLATLGWCGLIYYLSDQSSLPAPLPFPHQDKLMHATAYAVMAGLFWQVWRQHITPASVYLPVVVVLCCSLYGISDEWHQSFVAGRDSSIGDWLADTAGALLLASFYRWRNTSIHHQA